MPNDPAFLGTGWSFPPGFARGGADVETVSGVEDIHQCLRILLATARGERVMNEDFGCDLDSVLFEEVDQGLVNRLNDLISDAILFHEPRIRLDHLDVSADETEDGKLLIRIEYTVLP